MNDHFMVLLSSAGIRASGSEVRILLWYLEKLDGCSCRSNALCNREYNTRKK